MRLETVGEKIGKIPVEISYRIIELFSAGLYSSPNKAFEELVCNSYDALANKVCVYVPLDFTTEDASLWVCDNGVSMDRNGLKQLWKIGSSNKRELVNTKRLQIGQFGIGKLATYVLARKLTYVCKNRKSYFAVTMDYSKVNRNKKKISLNVRKMSLEQVKDILAPFISISGQSLLSFNLWGKDSEASWTFSIMSDLKPKSKEILEGKLKWVLRTALPLNPDFELFYNGNKLVPSKQNIQPIKTWIMGDDDSTATKYYSTTTHNGRPAVNFANLKSVSGEFQLYEDSLVTGKSEKLGRSHGIFLMVRNRLVNNDDPLLGMDAFMHGAFNRTRITIYADGLDEYITSTRESIKESPAYSELKEYIKRKFNNEVREFWNKRQVEISNQSRASYKVTSSSGSLSRRPLLVVARKYINNEITNLVLTKVSESLSPQEQRDFLAKLEDDLTSESGVIKNITCDIMDPKSPLAQLDLYQGIVRVNLMHPFFSNFSEDVKTILPFQLIAVTEILTEAYLIELGIDQETVKTIMLRRDTLLRELTFSDRPSAPAVATMIRDSLADSTGLEDALYSAFNSLGFETTKKGGKGEPDGIAVAILGYRGDKKSADYSLVYDAKSTSKEAIKAGTAQISGLLRHKQNYKSDYAAVIARDFEGADDPDSSISKEAKQHNICLIRAKDLIKVVMLSAPKQIGLIELENLFKSCHTVIETSAWVNKLRDKQVDRGPIKELLDVVFELQKKDTEPPEIAAIRMNVIFHEHSPT